VIVVNRTEIFILVKKIIGVWLGVGSGEIGEGGEVVADYLMVCFVSWIIVGEIISFKFYWCGGSCCWFGWSSCECEVSIFL